VRKACHVSIMRNVIAFLLLTTAPALADTCPAAPDIRLAEERLLAQLQTAQDETTARGHMNALWSLWTKAPDETAGAMLDRGVGLMQRGELLLAAKVLDGLTVYCPDWAEGWNQRAFVAFQAGDFANALTGLDRALALDPRHVAALSGRGLTLLGLGREAEGRATLESALRLNRWMPERKLLEKLRGKDL
jgi:Flp pilus assembly protein TadD